MAWSAAYVRPAGSQGVKRGAVARERIGSDVAICTIAVGVLGVRLLCRNGAVGPFENDASGTKIGPEPELVGRYQDLWIGCPCRLHGGDESWSQPSRSVIWASIFAHGAVNSRSDQEIDPPQ